MSKGVLRFHVDNYTSGFGHEHFRPADDLSKRIISAMGKKNANRDILEVLRCQGYTLTFIDTGRVSRQRKGPK